MDWKGDSWNDMFGTKPQSDGIPKQGDDEEEWLVGLTDYLGKNDPCASFTRQRPLHGLGIKRPAHADKIIEYYDVEADAENAWLHIVMGARKVWRVDITGRNLLRLMYLLKERRIDWIRQAVRDGYENGALYIESIKVTDVTKERDES